MFLWQLEKQDIYDMDLHFPERTVNKKGVDCFEGNIIKCVYYFYSNINTYVDCFEGKILIIMG